MLGNQPDHQYFLYGESREKGNVMVVNDKGYLGPICDENWDIEEVKPIIQQTKMLVTCQSFGDLFLFGLIWQYSSNHKTYNKGRFKVIATYLQQ